MMSGKIKSSVVLLSLVMVMAANASPTVRERNKDFAACVLLPVSGECSFSTPEIDQAAEPFNSQLADIAAEFLRPPADSVDPQTSFVRSLPAVPGTLLMVLTGFFYVSLVKDRRTWLTALAGLLWLGHAGIAALPQLACHLHSKKQIEQLCSVNITHAHGFEHSSRLRSDIEGTKYIGILRRLAGIPDVIKSFSLHPLLPSLRMQRAFSPERGERTRSFGRIPQSAIIYPSACPIKTATCPAAEAERVICFSPAFIFNNLARGPPETA